MANVNFPTNSSQKVLNLSNSDIALADEGGYFVTTNPTTGTAIAMTTSVVDDAATASSTHAQFAPVMIVFNPLTADNQNAPSIYLRYLRMMLVQVPTSATSWRFSIRLDSTIRYASGGSELDPVNVNPSSSKASAARVFFGAIVPAALPTANARLVANGLVNSAIPVTLDQWLFTFGNSSPHMDQLNAGAGAKNITIACPPIVLPPGWSMSLGMWGAANAAAPSWEFEMGHVERIPGL